MASSAGIGLQDIFEEIKSFKTEFKTNFASFKHHIKKEMKEEIESLKESINLKLTEIKTKIANHAVRLEESEQRITEMEDWNVAAIDALIRSLKHQQLLQERLDDLEGRSRRNNMRIFGLKEGVEEGSVEQFIEKPLKMELLLPPNSALNIQRAHRALLSRPAVDKPPRSVVINFLQYTTKEMVLKEAWKKKVMYQDKQLFFDHDYATNVVQKRKEYTSIEKALKERGIHFQIPLTKIRIYWESVTRSYESAPPRMWDGWRCRGGAETWGSKKSNCEELLPGSEGEKD